MLAIGTLSMTLGVGCANKKEFVMRENVDRFFVSKGQVVTAPEDGVYLSNRAFKFYSKGCE